jgi:hypothetical protein
MAEYYSVLLVSEERLKSYTGLDENVRVEDITPYILVAQDKYIEKTLGSKFYNRLKEGVKQDDLTDNEFEFLQEYVAKALMFYSLYEMMPYIKYKLVNKGILVGTSEEAAVTDLTELKYLRQNVLDTAEYYNKRMLIQLMDYPGRFSQYEVPGIKGLLPDKTSPYFSGLVTTMRKGYKGKYYCDPFYGPSSYTNNNEN